MKVLSGVALGILLTIGIGIAIIYSGLYSVAAVEPHNPMVRWVLETAMHRSVAVHAEDVQAPAEFREDQVAAGAEHYASTCVMCHAAPGREASEAGRGLRPQPPELARERNHWSSGETFWIVKHGIKMTGMPAFGPTHSDEDLWAIVAFVERLRGMSAEEYAAFTAGADRTGHDARHGSSHGSHGH